jgi:hypothetical protein
MVAKVGLGPSSRGGSLVPHWIHQADSSTPMAKVAVFDFKSFMD